MNILRCKPAMPIETLDSLLTWGPPTQTPNAFLENLENTASFQEKQFRNSFKFFINFDVRDYDTERFYISKISVLVSCLILLSRELWVSLKKQIRLILNSKNK